MNKESLLKKWKAIEVLRTNMLKKLEALPDDQIRKFPSEGKWSAIQNIEHLLASEKGTLAYLSKKTLSPTDQLPKTNFTTKLRSVLLNTMLRQLVIKMKAPSIIKPPSNDRKVSEVSQEWDKTRQEFKAFIKEQPLEKLEKAVFKHPLVGRINMAQTLTFMEAHQRRHFDQIDTLLKD